MYLASVFGGVIGICIYLLGVLISWACFPRTFSPLTNMISDLGNSIYNPLGAIWFNLGNIVLGFGLVPFWYGIRVWYTCEKHLVPLVKITQIAGYCLALSIMMIGIFPENLGVIHGFWGQFFFCSNLGVGFLSFISFRTHPKFPKGISLYCLIVAILNGGYAFAPIQLPIIEWIAYFPAIGLVVLMMANIMRIFQKTGPSPPPMV